MTNPNICLFDKKRVRLNVKNIKINKFLRSIKKQLPLILYVSYRLMEEEEEERKSIVGTTTQTYSMVCCIRLNLGFGGSLFW